MSHAETTQSAAGYRTMARPGFGRVQRRRRANFLCAFAAVAGAAFAVPASGGMFVEAHETRVQQAGQPARLDAARRAQAEAMMAKAMEFLRSAQDPATGGWLPRQGGPVFPAVSALALSGMLGAPGIEQDAAFQKGVQYVLGFRKPDGGIYAELLPSYNTAICLSLITKLKDPAAQAAVVPARDYLLSLQFGDGTSVDAQAGGKVDQSHPFYGGIGYGRHGRPDNSNLNFLMQAFQDAGLPPDSPGVKKALRFLARTQMLDQVNDMPYADGSNQGGFIYSTSVNSTRVGEGQSFAGEVAESLSGPPGTIASFTLAKDAAGKERTLPKRDVEERLKRAAAGEADVLREGVLVLLGPTPDGLSSSTFTLRTPIREPEALRALIRFALGPELGEAEIRAEVTEHWRGTSRLRAYGSMTYAGFKSLIYAGLSRTDPRVEAATAWIARNYTLQENPGLGTDGMYYYFLTFARALDAWGEVRITNPDVPGEGRNWAADLVDRLSSLQGSDGSFQVLDDRWMEDDRVLITAYALLALRHATR